MLLPDLAHVLLHAHLQHVAIDRIERELQSKRKIQRKLVGMLIAMDEKEQQLAMTVH